MFNLANYHTHPEHKDYTIFTFKNKEQGHFFESKLLEENIPFEKAIDEEKQIIMFGIKSTLFAKAQKINADSFAKHKKAFIPDNTIRYTVLGIFFVLVLIAIAGYVKTKYF
jgi:hypothetical protein